MATNGASINGNAAKPPRKFDPTFTQRMIDATGPKATPRIRQVMGSAMRHLHDWARENEITVDEWMAGVDMINKAGQMSNETRNEGQLLCGVLGLETLVDEITYKLSTDSKDQPTASAILGPFYRHNAPKRAMGDTIVSDIENGDPALIFGQVIDFKTGKPIEGAVLDVWHAAPNGLYEQQDPDQPDFNLRGRFTTGPDGSYNFYCLRPTSYPIPNDGPAGKLLQLLDRHPFRPAHIHFIVSAPGYRPIVTQVFDCRDKYIKSDSVFAVKDDLIVDFIPRKGDPKAQYELAYDFKLASQDDDFDARL